jgi:hypothetical protein
VRSRADVLMQPWTSPLEKSNMTETSGPVFRAAK